MSVRAPEEWTFFRLRVAPGFFYRFKGSLQTDHGGVIGQAFQARLCTWDDNADVLNEIDGDEVWVRIADVSTIYDSQEDAHEDAREYYYLNE